jgi:ABC-type sugar transport system ATPase subunit
MDEVFSLADRITVLRDGRSIWTRAAARTTPDEVIETMVDRPTADIYAHHPLPPGPPVLEVSDLKVSRQGTPLLDVGNFVVNEGEIVGLAGVMGAGRTCLLRSLVGALDHASVEGRFRGPHDEAAGHAPRHPAEALTRGLFLTPEDRKLDALFMEDDLATNITAASSERYIHAGAVDQQRLNAACNAHLASYEVKAAALSAPVATLSGGNQQKILFCRAAEVSPKLLLLDEPTRGIDIGAKAAIYRQMEKWTREGWSILWSSSELPELLGISDRIYVLAGGRITAEFKTRPFRDADIMTKAAVA